ncbi:MAG: hypothetical protein QXH55_02605 [Candidatus Korarchaeota archaeon]|nr:hypothetical protein [Thermoproteota archaeon]MCR8462978.1 hypothetical protein [Thermoproteota archaeon]MCR8471158.1 hypothetical protein [Thermoproteota archaeon]MCR8472308.1 hypothetical protein [Thermoproteota archaeon]MCR8473698.1 hypothetical protein [Thermoproteota archaeon]
MALFEVIGELHPRGISYAILSLIIENTDIVYLIVDSEEEKEALTEVLLELKDQYELRRCASSTIKLKDFKVVPADSYYMNWEEYSGRRLIFVKQDRNLRSPVLDMLTVFIESMWRVRARDPVKRIAVHIADVLLALDVIKEHYRHLRELIEMEMTETDPKKKKELAESVKKKQKELMSMLEARFPRKEDALLAYELAKFLF